MTKPVKLGIEHFLSNTDISKDQTEYILNLALAFKNGEIDLDCGNKVLGLVFDKASTRTRVSFQVAMSRLGGSTVDLNPSNSQIGRGELIKDTARVLSKYCDIIAIRTFKHENLLEYANWSEKPIINALTDLEHPCQALADFLTIKEEFGRLDNLVVTFIGDSNNVFNSLLFCGAHLGSEIRIACPRGFEPSEMILDKLKQVNESTYSKIVITQDVERAVSGADVLYTDVWCSMGQEDDKEFKDNKFQGFSINSETFSFAKENAIVLHCLPAYRGKEITDEIIDSQQSRIFQQAANRMHIQQALLASLLI